MCLFFSSPCAKIPHSFPHAVVQVYLVTGSLAKVWYFEIFSPETGWTTGIQKWSSLIAVLILCSSRRMDWGMKYSGLVPQTVAVIAVNFSCEIILLLWNFGSGMYGIFLVSYSINAGRWGVPIWPNLAGVFSGTGDVCIGFCIAACVLFLLFLFVPFSPLLLTVYPLGIHTNLVCVIFLCRSGWRCGHPWGWQSNHPWIRWEHAWGVS